MTSSATSRRCWAPTVCVCRCAGRQAFHLRHKASPRLSVSTVSYGRAVDVDVLAARDHRAVSKVSAGRMTVGQGAALQAFHQGAWTVDAPDCDDVLAFDEQGACRHWPCRWRRAMHWMNSERTLACEPVSNSRSSTRHSTSTVFITWVARQPQRQNWAAKKKPCKSLTYKAIRYTVTGGASGIRTPDLRIMIPSL